MRSYYLYYFPEKFPKQHLNKNSFACCTHSSQFSVTVSFCFSSSSPVNRELLGDILHVLPPPPPPPFLSSPQSVYSKQHVTYSSAITNKYSLLISSLCFPLLSLLSVKTSLPLLLASSSFESTQEIFHPANQS